MTTGALLLRRDVVLVTGPDAESYLQGQLSQDIAALAVGDSACSLLLQPQGKVDAFLRVTRGADDRFALDVDAGWGDHVVARLRRFLLRVQVTVEPVDWPVVAVRWLDLPDPDGCLRIAPEVPGDGYDLIGPGARVPDGAPELDPADYEAMRIAAGVPRMGTELDESTIPASAGIVDRSVSFTKGCYTGQELVARIDSRGDRVPAKLRVVRGQVAAGTTLLADGREVGRVTSSAGGNALAYVRREIEPPATLTTSGGVELAVEAIP